MAGQATAGRAFEPPELGDEGVIGSPGTARGVGCGLGAGDSRSAQAPLLVTTIEALLTVGIAKDERGCVCSKMDRESLNVVIVGSDGEGLVSELSDKGRGRLTLDGR